jgi:hypothetical protein
MESTPFHPIPVRTILILPSHYSFICIFICSLQLHVLPVTLFRITQRLDTVVSGYLQYH